MARKQITDLPLANDMNDADLVHVKVSGLDNKMRKDRLQELLDTRGQTFKEDLDMGNYRIRNISEDTGDPSSAIRRDSYDAVKNQSDSNKARLDALESGLVYDDAVGFPGRYIAVGGETEVVPGQVFTSATVFVNAAYQQVGAVYTVVNNRIVFVADELEPGDIVDYVLGVNVTDQVSISQLNLSPISASSVLNASIFLDQSDSLLKFKNSSGVVQIIQVV